VPKPERFAPELRDVQLISELFLASAFEQIYFAIKQKKWLALVVIEFFGLFRLVLIPIIFFSILTLIANLTISVFLCL